MQVVEARHASLERTGAQKEADAAENAEPDGGEQRPATNATLVEVVT